MIVQRKLRRKISEINKKKDLNKAFLNTSSSTNNSEQLNVSPLENTFSMPTSPLCNNINSLTQTSALDSTEFTTHFGLNLFSNSENVLNSNNNNIEHKRSAFTSLTTTATTTENLTNAKSMPNYLISNFSERTGAKIASKLSTMTKKRKKKNFI